MLTSKLRPLLPRLIRHLRNHELAQFQSTYQSPARPALGHRAYLKLEGCTMSTIAQPPEETVGTDTSSVGKTEDSPAVPTASGGDSEAKATNDKTVAILWDLDNKQPYALPENVAAAIRALASERGKIIEFSAMANYHAFIRLSPAAKELRAERNRIAAAEERGEIKRTEPYRCPYCGNKFKTIKKMEKHYKMLHERERKKKLTRLNMLKGKKREKWLAKNGKNLMRRNEAHIEVKAPEKKHKLYRSLNRAGVRVRVVSKASQAADNELKGRFGLLQKHNNLTNLTLIVISDDSDFCKMVKRARTKHGIHVIVISERPTLKLAKEANEWLSWDTLNENAHSIVNTALLRESLVAMSEAGEGEDNDRPDYVLDDDVKQLLAQEEKDTAEFIEEEDMSLEDEGGFWEIDEWRHK
ncbi:uncharacterized protein F4807DRAFT_386809 [Annulohypoxylon truncatum]|uniref:uncharacterized protein n=1 Tax=Annulohypoxylon truncatum TaxID=327061 RepID=UPI002007878C|nr:uncharacterized protein F4807DRAFT_386809 [Annulohypoxylon truncatum]KAI1212058.1 hypothetical protein F4807DRAFT_386809 [Annulohypoxylon truncatum]